MTTDKNQLARVGTYSITTNEPKPQSDPFAELRDQLAVLEEEATRLLSGQRENALVELSPVRRVFRYVSRLRTETYGLQSELSAANERIAQFAARLRQLEGIVQSSFARAVKGLSANAPAAQQGAERVVYLVEEHVAASRFLDEQQVPGATLLARVQWLNDKATKTVVTEAEDVAPGRGLREVIDVQADGAIVKR